MFDAQAELTALRARRAADWLRRERRCKVHHTTVMRFLKLTFRTQDRNRTIFYRSK